MNCSFALNYNNFNNLSKRINNLIKKYKPPKKFLIKKITNFDNYFKI